MPLPAPSWHNLLAGLPQLNTAEARADLSRNILLVTQNHTRLVFTTYGNPRAALVPLKDAALLQALDQNPELRAAVHKLLPN